ncbi:hypothetical protein M378DRAFT_945101 [Amanita muscaria Koide BX008]|uniref:Uncharacterized protein n=1 Tax=Amanita muscaria (strain Koide BX008) TaxID=946122 RepID=A0A0C2XFR3_AMAMK|nr:hypothetical protein M378DRAFT_945101 [Amanita muscaria Koide BX008]
MADARSSNAIAGAGKEGGKEDERSSPLVRRSSFDALYLAKWKGISSVQERHVPVLPLARTSDSSPLGTSFYSPCDAVRGWT